MKKRYRTLFIMMIPGLIYLLINNYLPMIGVFIAFKDINFTKGILHSDWIGFKNFEYLFKTSDAFVITRNTLLYNLSFIIINLVVAIILALILMEIKKVMAARFFQSVILLPYLMSMVIVGYLVYSILSVDKGFVNKTILPMLGKEEIMWYSQAKYWPVILTIVNTWKNAGYLCVIYYAAMVGIDKSFYEAALIDGASKWQQIRFITLPSIMQVVIVMTLLQIGRIFYADFGLFYQVTLDSGMISETTNVIDTYVYRALLKIGDIGMSSAAGVYQSIVGFVLVMISNLIVKKIDAESALF